MNGGLYGWGGALRGTMSTAIAQLSADVSMSSANTWYDGPSIACDAGTWLLLASITLSTGGSGDFTVKLWDGTTALSSAAHTVGGSWWADLGLVALVTVGSRTLYKVSARFTSGGATIKATGTNAPSNTSSTIIGVKVG